MNDYERAANNVNFAHSLDLQLFNDYEEAPVEETQEFEEAQAEEAEETEETQETPEGEEDPAAPAAEEVTQTQTFARRLKEETSRAAQEANDTVYAKLYEGQVMPISGKPILSEADYNQALYEMEMQNAGVDDIDRLVSEHPDVKAARIEKESMQRQQQIYAEWSELTEEYPEVKDFSQIPKEVFALKEAKGIPLLDAYNRIHVKKVKLETEQETIRKLNKNAASSPGSALDDGVVHKTKNVADMTQEEFEAYREEVRNQRKE